MSQQIDLPVEIPRLGNSITAAIGKIIIRLMGWKLEGTFPAEKKVMVALAPHTSNWDFIVAMPFIMAYRVKISWLMKREAFFFPFKGLFMWLGGVPTNRGSAGGIAKQVAKQYRNNEKMWVGITPEGTRRKVTKWKSGFLRIAYAAEVPILLIAWDFSRRRFCLDSLYWPTGNLDEDMREIQYRFSKYQGFHRNMQTDTSEVSESSSDRT
ncbi:1-acyl-sn-glycerol-3-phosphate acyltransferase [Microbulbifer variabilis]|uniref:1-acyl-sn-glycerol-3-phosphate acyltransferase n=1 Tax=Microbulbifer variabilis TaxID=266805 RepID=UPI001CFD0421|nr:1-acyl-sn-glycerol-3-phosphate acyltransferase [Microbulbifer variabilis]